MGVGDPGDALIADGNAVDILYRVLSLCPRSTVCCSSAFLTLSNPSIPKIARSMIVNELFFHDI